MRDIGLTARHAGGVSTDGLAGLCIDQQHIVGTEREGLVAKLVHRSLREVAIARERSRECASLLTDDRASELARAC